LLADLLSYHVVRKPATGGYIAYLTRMHRFLADMGLLITDKNFVTSRNNCGYHIVTNVVCAELPAQNELFGKLINDNIVNSETEFLLEEETN
jgi:hypothetical protein